MNFTPYILPVVLTLILLILMRLQANAARKAIRAMEERVQVLELQLASSEADDGAQALKQHLEKAESDFREEIRKAQEENDLKITQLQDDLRSTLNSFMESTDKKLSDNEALTKTRNEEVIEKVTALLRQAIRKPEQKKEEEPAPVRPAVSPIHEKAKRLARLIVSDIVLYNKDAVDEGIKNGRFDEVMAHEIQEARKLYASRVPEEIRNKTNYLDEAFADLIERKKKEFNIS